MQPKDIHQDITLIGPLPQQGFWEYFNPVHLVRQLIRHRDLLWQFVWWEVNDRYSGSALGLLWAVIVPLLRLSVYTLVFSVLLGGRKAVWGLDSNFDVGAMIFCGFALFNVFAESIGRASHLMWANRTYVKNIVFPLEIIPVVVISVALIHTLIGLGVLVVLVIFINGVFHWTFLYLPLTCMPLIFLVAGISWFLATLGVFNRDVDNLIQSLIQVLFLLSAIFFPLDALLKLFPARWQWIVRFNLLSSIVEDGRRVILKGIPPDWFWLAADTAASLVLMLAGYACFMYYKRQFADVI